MNMETYRYCLKTIEDRFHKSYHKDVKNFNWPEFKDIPDKAFESAVDIILLSFEKGSVTTLPRMDQVMSLVKEQSTKIRRAESIDRENQAAKEKGEYKTIGQFRSPTEFGKMCCSLLQDFLAGGMTKEVYLLTAIKIGEHYGKSEWVKELQDDLQKYYRQQRDGVEEG